MYMYLQLIENNMCRCSSHKKNSKYAFGAKIFLVSCLMFIRGFLSFLFISFCITNWWISWKIYLMISISLYIYLGKSLNLNNLNFVISFHLNHVNIVLQWGFKDLLFMGFFGIKYFIHMFVSLFLCYTCTWCPCSFYVLFCCIRYKNVYLLDLFFKLSIFCHY